MIQAVIFDMDGLLIDSEPLWKEAEIREFGKVGVPLTVALTDQTMGLRTDEVVEYWHGRYPWEGVSKTEVAERVDRAVAELIQQKGQPKAGVSEAVAVCKVLNLKMAIASSSSPILIETVIDRLGLKQQMQVVHSAHAEPYGKPHPAVYITAAEKLGVAPENCLALEDSANGVLSAKAAKMRCVAIPEPEARTDKRFGIADVIIDSLNDFTPELIKDW